MLAYVRHRAHSRYPAAAMMQASRRRRMRARGTQPSRTLYGRCRVSRLTAGRGFTRWASRSPGCRSGAERGARYPANDTRLRVDPLSLVIHRAPSVDSATPCWSVSNPTSENPPGGPARAAVQAPPEETRTVPFQQKRLPVIAVTPSGRPVDERGGAAVRGEAEVRPDGAAGRGRARRPGRAAGRRWPRLSRTRSPARAPGRAGLAASSPHRPW